MIVATFKAWSTLSIEDVRQAVDCHILGHWGPVTTEERKANETAILKGGTTVSTHTSNTGGSFHLLRHIKNGEQFFICYLPEDKCS